MPGVDTSRIKTLQGHLETKTSEIEGMAASWKTEDGGQFVLQPEEFEAYQSAVGDAERIKGLILAETKVAGFRTFLDAPDGDSEAARDAANSERSRYAAPGRKSLADAVINSDAFKEMATKGFNKAAMDSFKAEFEGDAMPSGLGTKDIHGLTGGVLPEMPALGRAQQVDMVQRTLRPNRVRDLFPQDRTTATMLYGVVETGFINRAKIVRQREMERQVQVNAAGTAAEVVNREVFGLKPKSDITVTTRRYPISTIAHLMDVHKEVLADEPRLRGLLDRDMVDGIKMVEDFEILYGAGEDDDIRGIVNTPGIQTYTQLATDKKSAAIRRSATRAALAYFTPSGVVMHPFDWEDLELEVDNNGAYTVAVSVAIGGEKRVWRMEVVDSPAVVEGRWLLGAFGTGAKVYDREQVNVTVSTENRDNFERNVVSLRAEERIAVEVSRPEAFVYGRFADAPA